MSDGADLKNGYARLANALIEALSRTNMGQHESRLIWVVIRKTYGWNKKSDYLSASQIAEASGLDRRHASRARTRLLQRRILELDDDGRLAINKHSDQWLDVPPEAHPKKQQGCASTGTPGVPPEAQGGASRGTVSVPPQAHLESQTSGKKKTAKRTKRRTSGKKSSTKGGVPPEAPQKTVNTGKDTKSKDTSDGPPARRRKGGKSNGAQPTPTAATWSAYRAAYMDRYGVEPVRNATVNSKLANLVKRLGQDLAPLVAAYYVTLNTRYYVQKGHTVGPMLVDAEKLATECRTQTRITETSARRADQSTERLSVFERLLQKEIESNEQ